MSARQITQELFMVLTVFAFAYVWLWMMLR